VSTKKQIAEQVLRNLSGGDPSAGSRVHILELYKAIEQSVNRLIKAQHFKETFASGETIPEGAVLATYENVSVTQWKDVSKSTLPAMPVALPKGMGVFEISLQDDAFGAEFIPIQPGQFTMALAQRLMSELLGQTGYELIGPEVIYTKDLTALDITQVRMRLVVLDASQYGEYDLLPIPADMEASVIEECVNLYRQPTEPKPNDNYRGK
jgi:cellobiose-specific phosphotransferase system component IIB